MKRLSEYETHSSVEEFRGAERQPFLALQPMRCVKVMRRALEPQCLKAQEARRHLTKISLPFILLNFQFQIVPYPPIYTVCTVNIFLKNDFDHEYLYKNTCLVFGKSRFS